MPGKRLMAPRAVDRDADELCAIALEFTAHFVVERDLLVTHWGPVCLIEGEDDRTVLQIAEPQRFERRRRQGEVGCDCPVRERCGHARRSCKKETSSARC